MKKAFTMAEVLITLMILGVIAMIVVPGAIQKANDRATVTQVKKAYSELSRALNMAIAENGTLDQWDWPKPNQEDTENSVFFAKTLSKYLNVRKFCGSSSGCFSYGYSSNGQWTKSETSNYFKLLTGSIATGTPIGNFKAKMTLTNGTNLAFYEYTTKNNGNYDMLYVIVDINGPNTPNQYGNDVFHFGIQNYGIIPEYRGRAWYDRANSSDRCNITISGSDGISCGHWILKHGNMDYKYRDVSAEW